MKRCTISIALLSLLFTPLAFGQKVIVVTKDNLPELRARYGPQFGPKPMLARATAAAATTTTASTASLVQIGTFSDTMFTNGTAAYEFYWGTDTGRYYTGPLAFKNITVFLNDNSQSSGPIDGTETIGILFAAALA
jgi:hypothetical protein